MNTIRTYERNKTKYRIITKERESKKEKKESEGNISVIIVPRLASTHTHM